MERTIEHIISALRSRGELNDDLAIDAADTIERQAKDLDAGRELMRQAWHEFNAIRARDGAPVGVSEEWWSQMTEELGKLLGDEAKPWMSDAAQALLAPSHAEICEVQDRVIKAEQERDAALAASAAYKKEIARLKNENDRLRRPRCIDEPAGDPCKFCGAREATDVCRDGTAHIITERDAALAEVERLKEAYGHEAKKQAWMVGRGGEVLET